MNTKTGMMIPAFAAIFALMFVAASPYVMAESGSGDRDWKDADKHHKKHHKAMHVPGDVVGSILVTESSTHDSLEAQVQIDLVDIAQNYPDLLKTAKEASLGMAKNDLGDKFVVWKLMDKSMDKESGTVSKTIHLIDAGNGEFLTTVEKQHDHSKMDGKYHSGDYSKKDGKYHHGSDYSKKLDRMEAKLSESTGNPDLDALRASFAAKLREMRDAMQSGENISDLREELRDIRNQIRELRSA